MRSKESVIAEEHLTDVIIEEFREKGIKFAPENSTSIKLCTYLSGQEAMLVDFQNGKSYVYWNIDKDTWEGLLKAASVGSFFHKEFKLGGKEFKKVVTAEDNKEVIES